MPYATNAIAGRRSYFEDDGGDHPVVVVHGGFGEPVDLVRQLPLLQGLPSGEFRLVYVDHRGHGRSDKPHDPGAYGIRLRAADAVGVLDELHVERAHFLGISWGGRLGFGIGQHTSDRVLSLVIGGQQPYRWPDSPLVRVVTDGLAESSRQGSVQPLVDAFERFWQVTFPPTRRASILANDPVALEAAWRAALAEGPVATDMTRWRVPCLIFLGGADADFVELARRAAADIPGARFLSLVGEDHFQAHAGGHGAVLEAVLATLRGAGGPGPQPDRRTS
jgi:pimeloyl-ACP methyl ester carboxylesterase